MTQHMRLDVVTSEAALGVAGDGNSSGAVARAYDRWAVQYDSDANRTRDLDALVVRREGLRVAGRDVLELGCGTGKNTEWFAASARRVTAIDFSPGMLSVARSRAYAAPVTFLQHDVRDAWPVADESVDVVVGNLVLEHVEHLAVIYSEAARVLRPGGQLLLAELHPFRQLRGGQAHFAEEQSGEVVMVPAFVHSTSEYVNAGLAHGLSLVQLGEWHDEDAVPGALPRLLSVLFERPAR